MIEKLWLAYSKGEMLLEGQWLPAGQMAAAALNCPREIISELENLYRSDDTAMLARRLRTLDCIRPVTGDISEEMSKDVLDDIVCFRVYIRYFLTRFCAKQDEAEALDSFLHSFDALSAQLRSEENLRRTVLPTELHPEMGYRTMDGRVCECFVFDSIGQLLLHDVMRALENGMPPRCCPSCGKYFVPEKSNVVYCSGIAPDGELDEEGKPKTCRSVGARKTYEKRSGGSDIMKAYSAACGRIYTRKSRGTIIPQMAKRLLTRCAELRDQAIAGKMTAAELEEELFQLTGGRRRRKA
ncbi:MAG: hypothetical protein E7559_05740 [Ruminococcaceae bacterium]|nr:hypothetical protein [Oscillospiraceae bacterium]